MIGSHWSHSLNKIHEKLCELYMVHLAAITEHCSSYKPSDQKATYNIYKAKHSQRNTTIAVIATVSHFVVGELVLSYSTENFKKWSG